MLSRRQRACVARELHALALHPRRRLLMIHSGLARFYLLVAPYNIYEIRPSRMRPRHGISIRILYRHFQEE